MDYETITPEQVAALFVKHGITPRRGYTYERDWTLYGCAIGALACEVIAEPTDVPLNVIQQLLDVLGFPMAWTWGVTHGFDGLAPDPLLGSGRYASGYEFGQAVAALVFAERGAAVPA